MLELMDNIKNLIEIKLDNLKFKSKRENLTLDNYSDFSDINYLCESYNFLVKATYKEDYWKDLFIDVNKLK